MEHPLYYLASGLLKTIQAQPLPRVARFGRAAGAAFYWLDARHRHVALRNLSECFGQEMTTEQIRALARENFRRIGENYCCAARTAAMSWNDLRAHCEIVGTEKLYAGSESGQPRSHVIAVGHFGNFELYARFGEVTPGFRCATTYRGVRPESLNRLLLSLREKSPCRFFERRTDSQALKTFMQQPSAMIGFFCDQHAGRGGLRLPFLGRECSTSAAPAIFALRYGCPLYTAVCYRIGIARWRIETGDEIPVVVNGHRRSPAEIMTGVNRALELAVRRDPANWFWVHNRWKFSGKRK